MPLPQPESGETHDEFIDRCMADKNARREFPDNGQRRGVCEYRWRKYPAKGGSGQPEKKARKPAGEVEMLWNPPIVAEGLTGQGGRDESAETDN